MERQCANGTRNLKLETGNWALLRLSAVLSAVGIAKADAPSPGRSRSTGSTLSNALLFLTTKNPKSTKERFHRKNRYKRAASLRCLTHGYMHGILVRPLELPNIHQQKTRFLLMDIREDLSLCLSALCG